MRVSPLPPPALLPVGMAFDPGRSLGSDVIPTGPVGSFLGSSRLISAMLTVGQAGIGARRLRSRLGQRLHPGQGIFNKTTAITPRHNTSRGRDELVCLVWPQFSLKRSKRGK